MEWQGLAHVTGRLVIGRVKMSHLTSLEAGIQRNAAQSAARQAISPSETRQKTDTEDVVYIIKDLIRNRLPG